MTNNFFVYLAVMACVTYLVRMLPLVLVKKKIKNRYVVSFLHYIPYAVLTVMTIPEIFTGTSLVPAIAGFIVAVVLAFFEKTLVIVAAFSCVAVFVTETVMKYLL